jgi:hypothetical protein
VAPINKKNMEEDGIMREASADRVSLILEKQGRRGTGLIKESSNRYAQQPNRSWMAMLSKLQLQLRKEAPQSVQAFVAPGANFFYIALFSAFSNVALICS